jgi:hypothetical protein
MSDNKKVITVHAQDLLASIGFCAQKIVAAVSHHAAGAPFPDPEAISSEIKRMNDLNETLKAMQQEPANTEAA